MSVGQMQFAPLLNAKAVGALATGHMAPKVLR